MRVRVRALGPQDTEAYVNLRRRALVLAPEAFGSSLEDDHTADPENESAGFERWGTDPAVMAIDGELVAADAMIRWLR